MNKEIGLHYLGGDFKTRTQIRRKLLSEELTAPLQLTKPALVRTFAEWQPIINRRQKEYQELLGIPETIHIEIATEKPILLVPIGDVHAEHPETNLEQFGKDIDLAKSVNAYFITLGDLTNSIFWKAEPSLMTAQESTMYIRSALKYMAEDGHLLASWLGDHDCLDEKTEVYTKRGWLKWNELNEKDNLLTINPDGGLLEWHKYEKKIVEDFDGELIHIKGKNIDLLGTENHRVFYQKRRTDKYDFIPLEQFASLKWADHYGIPNASTFNFSDYPISDELIRLVAWLITDGWIQTRKGYGYQRVCYTQKEEDAHLITDILDGLGFKYSAKRRIRTRDKIDGMKIKSLKPSIDIGVCSKDSKKILDLIKDKKSMPSWVYKLSDRQFDAFLDSLIDGDGTRLPRMKNCACFYQKSKKLIDELQALCAMHNIKTNIYEYKNRMGNKQYRLNINFRKDTRLVSPKAVRENYKGKIWDVSIPPNRNFFVRRNGKAYFTGNSWAFDKHGSHTLYADFWEKFNAHLLDGVSYVDIGLNNGDTVQKYGIVGSHRHPGHSIYNSSHQCLRQWRDEGVGSLISISAHKHTKAHNQQTHKLYGGKEVVFHSVAIGTYKESDRYSRKHGWPRKGEKTAGAFGIVLYPGKEKIHIFWELEDAVDALSKA